MGIVVGGVAQGWSSLQHLPASDFPPLQGRFARAVSARAVRWRREAGGGGGGVGSGGGGGGGDGDGAAAAAEAAEDGAAEAAPVGMERRWRRQSAPTLGEVLACNRVDLLNLHRVSFQAGMNCREAGRW
jgi:hypothetical protein